MDLDKLISLVQEHLPLWDTRDKRYHSRDIQKQLWTGVANEMDVAVDDVKKKWRGLRDTFRKEYIKYNDKPGEEAADLNTSSWPYYHQMLFLEDVLAPGKLHGNVSPLIKTAPQSDVETETLFLTCEDNDSQFIKKENDGSLDSFSTIYQQRFVSDGTPEMSGTHQNSIRISNVQPARSDAKRKRTTEHNGEETFHEMERRKFAALSDSATLKNNSDYQFLVSLLPFLMKVSPRRKLVVRNKLQQVFIDEENAEAREGQFSSSNHVTGALQME